MDNRTEELLTEFRDLIQQYAEAKAHLVYIEEFKKSKLAMCMNVAERDGAKTVASQEKLARCDTDYLQVLDALKEATENEARYRFLLKKIEYEIEIWRSQQANNRLERKAYGA